MISRRRRQANPALGTAKRAARRRQGKTAAARSAEQMKPGQKIGIDRSCDPASPVSVLRQLQFSFVFRILTIDTPLFSRQVDFTVETRYHEIQKSAPSAPSAAGSVGQRMYGL